MQVHVEGQGRRRMKAIVALQGADRPQAESSTMVLNIRAW